MTTFLLIRHATNDMVGKALAGWTPNVHLNAEGQAQAQRLAEHLANAPIKAIYSSPLERAVETAQPIAQQLGLEVQILAGVGEIQFGEWTGRTIKELADTPTWTNIQRFPSGTRIPGGETLREMQNRVVDALEALRQQHPNEVIAVFAHADVVKAMIAHYLGVHLDLFQRIIISPASVTVVTVNDSGPHVLCVNHTSEMPSFPEAKPASNDANDVTPETERPVG
ncbi:MSMEG_4193 family putative phosphomutase [Herpetosiphon llansteffanensis]|uniref:MSMEG_4193 family putative phosphomutase n=1 Tax=Herpetosiphon llansteffanensis TaxID=2094568 RepID=UPI000D7BEA38|nr:MSMEG_4193 family putative phosphomutase [Herpetosiphon llansteffanensis]